MNKVIKLVSILLMVVMLTVALSTVCFADIKPGDIKPGTAAKLGTLETTGKDILATIRNIAAILSVILIAVLGVKFMMGSTEEKAEYKKSFMPLIIGMVVVLSATAIASFIWDIADNEKSDETQQPGADIVTIA